MQWDEVLNEVEVGKEDGGGGSKSESGGSSSIGSGGKSGVNEVKSGIVDECINNVSAEDTGLRLHPMAVVAGMLRSMEELEELRTRVKMSKEEFQICNFIMAYRQELEELQGVNGEKDESGEGIEGGGEIKKLKREEGRELACAGEAGEAGLETITPLPHPSIIPSSHPATNPSSLSSTDSSTHPSILSRCEDLVIECPVGLKRGKMMCLHLLTYLGRPHEYRVCSRVLFFIFFT